MVKKLRSAIVIILLIVLLPVSGCYDAVEIDEEVYALAIGIDRGTGNDIRVTFQYAAYKEGGPGQGGGGGTGGGGGGTENGEVDGTIVTTIEAASLLEALNLINTAENRNMSLMHVKMLVLAEEFAQKGIAGYVEPLVRFREVREFMRVVVCKGSAADFIKENKTLIGPNAAKGIDLMFEQSKKNGYFPDVFFNDFYLNLISPYGQPTAIYAGVNDFQRLAARDVESIPAVVEKEMDPGTIPRTGGSKKELLGTAIFDGDRMVGAIGQNETRLFLMGIGEFRRGYFTFEDRENPGYVYDMEVRLERGPDIKARFENNIPVIDFTIQLEADFVSIQSRKDYENLENIKRIEGEIEDYFRKGLKKTITRTQQEWNSDIFHFGEKIAGCFNTIDELEQYNWLKHYKEAEVNVKATVKIRGSGFTFGASPIRSASEDGK